jgi:hypothetical protein
MKVEIIGVHGQGDFDEEYVSLQVLEDCDIGHYVIADSTYFDNGKISNKVRHTYWFPDKQVKKDDIVTLWTKPGTNTTGTSKSGKPLHRFFWDLKEAVWNDEGDCAVLLEISDWEHFKVKG